MIDYYELERLFIPPKFTVEELASLLDISPQTATRLVLRKQIKTNQQGFILKEDLLQYLKEREVINLPDLKPIKVASEGEAEEDTLDLPFN